MKALSIKSLFALGMLVSAMVIGLGQDVFASGPSVTVNALKVKGLGNFVGQNLTVYYAVGKKASIATEPSQINISAVKAQSTVRISGGEVLLPQVQIPLLGVSTYNIIVFVVHSQASFRWVNVSGEVPENEKAAGANVYTAIQSTSKQDIDSAKAQLGIQDSNTALDVQLF